MIRDKRLLAVTALVVGVILIGEAYIYTFDADSTYSASSSMDASGANYSVGSGISNVYDVVVSDNGGFVAPSEYYIYYDPGYADALEEVWHAIGGKALDQEYYVSQMLLQLENRGIHAKVLNATELRAMMESGSAGKALIAVSGALPDTVYTGDVTDLAVSWVKNGGSLYWAGNVLGKYYSTPDETVPVTGFEGLFLSGASFNETGPEKAYEEVSGNGYLRALCLMNNAVKYSVDTSSLTDYLTVGYVDGGYASAVLAQCGSGMVTIIGGDYSNNQRADLVQIVASHICYGSVLVGHVDGKVTRSTVSGTIEMTASSTERYSVYIYLGGYYLEYARCFDYLGTTAI